MLSPTRCCSQGKAENSWLGSRSALRLPGHIVQGVVHDRAFWRNLTAAGLRYYSMTAEIRDQQSHSDSPILRAWLRQYEKIPCVWRWGKEHLSLALPLHLTI